MHSSGMAGGSRTAARILRLARLLVRAVLAVIFVLGFIETVQGAPNAAKWLTDAGVTQPQPLGVILAAVVVVIVGLGALGPERVKYWWAWARGQSMPSTSAAQAKLAMPSPTAFVEGAYRVWHEADARGPVSDTKALSLVDRLERKLSRGQALTEQMHEFFPKGTIDAAREWSDDIDTTLVLECPDLARRWRSETGEIVEVTDHPVGLNLSKRAMEAKVAWLRKTIEELKAEKGEMVDV